MEKLIKKKTKLWNFKIAKKNAKKENIILTKKHWIIIQFVKNFYIKYNILPSIRIIIQGIKEEHKIYLTSIDLFKLFPKGIIKQVCKISKIPNLKQCF